MIKLSKFSLPALVVSAALISSIGYSTHVFSQTLEHVPIYLPYLAMGLALLGLLSIFYGIQQHFILELKQLNQAFTQLAHTDSTRTEIAKAKKHISTPNFSAHIKKTVQELLQALNQSAQQAEQLQQQQTRLESALKGSGIMLWDWDIASGQLTISAAFADYLEVTPKALPENISRFLYLMPPEQRQHLKDILKTHGQNGQAFYHAFNLITPNDTQRWCTLRAQAVYDENGQAIRISGVIEDITEQKTQALQQEHSQNKLQQQLSAVNAGLITVSPEGRIMSMNKTAQHITQINSEQASGQPLWEVLRLRRHAHRHPCFDLLEKVKTRAKTQYCQQSIVLYDNENQEYHIVQAASPLFDEHNNLEGILITFHDISHIQMAARYRLYKGSKNGLKNKKSEQESSKKEELNIHILPEQREKLLA